MTTLVIVESPGKIKTIGKLLGPGYNVQASYGHVRDLDETDIGVNPPDFKPHYKPTSKGKKHLAELKEHVSKADKVLLATDQDREGEAIAWHLAEALKIKNPVRIAFTEITEKGVKGGLASPRPLHMNLVRAQEARRVLDRFVGWLGSGAVSDHVGKKASAGRVQSPALRLIVELEDQIINFKSTEHYGVVLTIGEDKATSWKATWNSKPMLADGAKYMTDRQLAERIANIRALTVGSFKESTSKTAPKPPFTTSTLQQSSQSALKFRTKKTMDLAQKLYEKGDITYHRTDKPVMADTAYESLVEFFAGSDRPFDAKVVDTKRTWQAKGNAQEAHECIRPTHWEVLEAGDDDEQKALYRLIWRRAVASQLEDALYEVREAKLTGVAGDITAEFIAKSKRLTRPGWKAVYEDDDKPSEEENAEAKNPVPADLTEGTGIEASDGKIAIKNTEPPSRYKESDLVKAMEALGIGRPATYAAIISNLLEREYITEDKKQYLMPLDFGREVVQTLRGRCKFIELDYTSKLEEGLDDLAEGKVQYIPTVKDAYDQLVADLKVFEPTEKHLCKKCGQALRRRSGQYGPFWGCTGYPKCDAIYPDVNGVPGEPKRVAVPASEHKCKNCNKPLVHRKGEGEKGPYNFWKCTGAPKCKTSYKSDANDKPIYPEGS